MPRYTLKLECLWRGNGVVGWSQSFRVSEVFWSAKTLEKEDVWFPCDHTHAYPPNAAYVVPQEIAPQIPRNLFILILFMFRQSSNCLMHRRIFVLSIAANETEQVSIWTILNKGIHFAKLKVIYLIPQPLIDAVGEAAVQATSNCGDSAWTSDMAKTRWERTIPRVYRCSIIYLSISIFLYT